MKNTKNTNNTRSDTNKPITAWTVEVNGKLDPSVCTTREAARYIRRLKSKSGTVHAHVRKVVIQVVPGAR